MVKSVEVTKFAQTKKVLHVLSSVKTMLISFFDVDGIMHREFVPPEETVNQRVCLNVFK